MSVDTTLEAQTVQLRALSRLGGEGRLRAALEQCDLVSRIHDAGVSARRIAAQSKQEVPATVVDEDIPSQR